MVIVVRIDLDKYDIDHLARLYVNGVVTMGEISESKAYKEMNELDQLRWTRKHQAERTILQTM